MSLPGTGLKMDRYRGIPTSWNDFMISNMAGSYEVYFIADSSICQIQCVMDYH
jgi:hypothetical protein